MKQPILVKFTGAMAEEHRVPAYEAAESLRGISLAVMISSYYLVEGRVRHRKFESRKFELNLVAQRPGSFESVLELASDPTLISIALGLSTSIGGTFIYEFIKSIINRSIGGSGEASIEALEAEDRLKTGDLTALVEAIEPAMRGAHKSIGYGASNIFIITGDHNNINLNERTKDYVHTSKLSKSIQIKRFSVASFNANSGYGRAYDFEERRTIPFEISSSIDRKSLSALLKSFDSYARRRRFGDDLASSVALKYQPVLSADGRVKKLSIIAARDEINGF
ncbi:hypothetical protein SAZ10_25780 [Mesorhizobium sp. BAC0120]|nr:hypothetical protein [Mesorhizobium sp. BAC0120]